MLKLFLMGLFSSTFEFYTVLIESNFQTETLKIAHLYSTPNSNTALSLNKSVKRYIHYYCAHNRTSVLFIKY